MSVLEKVSKHPLFAGRPEQNLISLVHELTDHQKIKEKFQHLLNPEEFEANIREIAGYEPAHSMEEQIQKEQQKHETARACYLPVQLFLSKLNRSPPSFTRLFTTLLRLEYGPLHVGLIVGGIKVEWDDSSLIVPTLSPLAGDVQTHIDGESELMDITQDAVGKMSLAHRQHLDTPKKLEIIYNSCAEKERLINQLVELIVKYNCGKQYSVFRCNCQDFVKEALVSLGIQKLPKFEGNLKGYIEGLQGGAADCVTFGEHSELDAYVRANDNTLKTCEKEYLICMYFQFHMAEMKDLSPEEQEEWKCPVIGCMCVDLDLMIVDDSLHFYQFRKQRDEQLGVGSLHISQAPTVSCIAEEVVVESALVGEEREREDEEVGGGVEDSLSLCSRQFLDHSESVEDQKAFLAKCSGYSERVKEKLRHNPIFLDQPEEEIFRVSEILSEKERFRERYFSEFIDTTSGNLIFEASYDQSKSISLPGGELQRRSSLRFEKLFNIPMKLLLRASSRHTRRFFRRNNPLHCALQVGDYVFQWTESSLVIPVDVSCLQAQPILLSPVHQQSEWFNQIHEEQGAVRQSVESNDYEMQIGLHFKWTERKDVLVSAFVDKIIEFNRDYVYHSQRCNSQRFVAEGMESLGIKNPPKLSSSIKQHISQLKRSTALSTKRLSSHRDLDTVVAEELTADLSKEDTEYLMAHYLLFHMDSFERSKRSSEEKWTCPVPECLLQDLEEKLDSFSKTNPL